MQQLTATQARKDFYAILKAKKPVEVKYKEGHAVILPKAEFDQMEMELIKFEIEKVINSGQKILSGEEVETMITEVLNA